MCVCECKRVKEWRCQVREEHKDHYHVLLKFTVLICIFCTLCKVCVCVCVFSVTKQMLVDRGDNTHLLPGSKRWTPPGERGRETTVCLCFRSVLSHVFLWGTQACCLSSAQLTVNILWVHNWYQELHHGLRPASGSWFNHWKVSFRTDLALRRCACIVVSIITTSKQCKIVKVWPRTLPSLGQGDLGIKTISN